MREVCFLIGRNGEVLWADVSGSPGALPDSRTRWEAIWERRHEIAEIAHSHPRGPTAFSHEDETTMEAIRLALGELTPRFSVIAPRTTLVRHGVSDTERTEEPWWANLLRLASGMDPVNQEEE